MSYINPKSLELILERGQFINDVSRLYHGKGDVVCDKCNTVIKTCCLHYKDLDLCMSCTQLIRDKQEKKPYKDISDWWNKRYGKNYQVHMYDNDGIQEIHINGKLTCIRLPNNDHFTALDMVNTYHPQSGAQTLLATHVPPYKSPFVGTPEPIPRPGLEFVTLMRPEDISPIAPVSRMLVNHLRREDARPPKCDCEDYYCGCAEGIKTYMLVSDIRRDEPDFTSNNWDKF